MELLILLAYLTFVFFFSRWCFIKLLEWAESDD
jgi:hypothetical protein